MIKKREKNNAAIYCRLSVDDGLDKESQSIENQKEILKKYCNEHGFNIFNIYIDDGFTGTNFDRPGLIKLKNDIESGFIDIVVTKDLPSNLTDNNLIEEERRLLYVAMTRAKEYLYLSSAEYHFINGIRKRLRPSIFLCELK